MTLATTARRRMVEGQGSVGQKARERRQALFLQTFPGLADMSVLDLGGRVGTWQSAETTPARVHVVNLEAQPPSGHDWLTTEQADACDVTRRTAGRRFDLVFSNAVLEHVGGHERRRQFAEAVTRAADRHWVQTPYRYFPLEPHWLFPGMQFLPLAGRATVARHWPLGHSRPTTMRDAVRHALEVELASVTEMRHYFPGSDIVRERLLGLTKSLIAVKTH